MRLLATIPHNIDECCLNDRLMLLATIAHDIENCSLNDGADAVSSLIFASRRLGRPPFFKIWLGKWLGRRLLVADQLAFLCTFVALRPCSQLSRTCPLPRSTFCVSPWFLSRRHPPAVGATHPDGLRDTCPPELRARAALALRSGNQVPYGGWVVQVSPSILHLSGMAWRSVCYGCYLSSP